MWNHSFMKRFQCDITKLNKPKLPEIDNENILISKQLFCAQPIFYNKNLSTLDGADSPRNFNNNDINLHTAENMQLMNNSPVSGSNSWKWEDTDCNRVSQGHTCSFCGKIYSRKYGLKIHVRTHTGYKPLKCKYCFRPFSDPSNLNKHERLHSESNAPYRCLECGKVLVRKRDLERHMKSRHPETALEKIN